MNNLELLLSTFYLCSITFRSDILFGLIFITTSLSKTCRNNRGETFTQGFDLGKLLWTQLRSSFALSRLCPHVDALGIEELKLNRHIPLPHIRSISVVIRPTVLLNYIVRLAQLDGVGSAELTLGCNCDTAVPRSHGEVVGLWDERERQLVETRGSVNGQSNEVGETVFDDSSKSLLHKS